MFCSDADHNEKFLDSKRRITIFSLQFGSIHTTYICWFALQFQVEIERLIDSHMRLAVQYDYHASADPDPAHAYALNNTLGFLSGNSRSFAFPIPIHPSD